MTQAQSQFQYQAVGVQQQPDAPMLYLLGVPADELLEWADVPSAKADYMAGYQRIYNQERARDVTDFLSLSPKNIIPGAIIVTIDSSRVEIDAKSDGSTKLRVDATARDFEESLVSTYENFRSRLSDAELDSISAEADGEEDGDEIEGEGIPESYLATLTAELKTAVEDFDALTTQRKEAIANYIDSISKPGLIIDGQHRVFGAKDVVDHDVYLPVVLIPGIDFAEQVFHFYVLNNKAKPLTPTELRRTISTSLTNREIDDLWQRFEDAGVNPEATRWTHKLHTDPRSPFQGLIDFGLGADGFLKENVMYQLVSKFVNMPKKYRILYEGIPAFDKRDDTRLEYFYAFWAGIYDVYDEVWDAGVEAGGNQLFMKASLLVLQEYVLDTLVQYTVMRKMDGGDSPFKDLDELERSIKGALNFLPPEFFSNEWQVKQIDTTDGHKFLRSQMEATVQNQGTKMGYQQLFKKAKQK
ncbi:hypothetical protein OS121_21045 [Mycolicibacterium mucogenicum]|uniref:hypothetical protein n=1 Tax=Mycolicibacterium mucogenicum TaxID=56689 RepID=UPI00226A9CDE|nr:hypothetical protein [Mycolicibacterium mucogenicum]MCX8557540.1 hypothetical protein [Mycolicibacterium mucogenicum]